MPKNTLLSAVLRGVLAGVAAIIIFAAVASLVLSMLADPLPIIYAAALSGCLIMGFFASVFAGKSQKEKPLWASLLAGLFLGFILLVFSAVTGDATGGFVKCGVLMLGALIGLLAVPAVSRKKSRYRKLVRNQ